MSEKTKNATVLMVDGFDADLTVLKSVLQEYFDLIEVKHGSDALKLLQELNDIDIVIAALELPDMNGSEFLQRVTADKRLCGVPVVSVVGGGGDTALRLKALRSGAMDVIVTPCDPELALNQIISLANFISRRAVQEQEMLKQKLFWQQEYDTLTGLYSKAGFYMRGRLCLDHHPNTEYVLVRGDIDRFKTFNDMFGMDAGDNLLVAIGQYLAAKQSDDMVLGRLEADHFAALCPKQMFHAYHYVDHFTKWLKKYPTTFNLTASIGIYEVMDSSVDMALMCDRALMALSTVKTSYRTRTALYDDQLRQSLIDEQNLTGEMETALQQGQFEVWFQPQINYDKGILIGAEALVRWRHPKRGLILPGVFIPLFEKNGFISKLDEYVWEKSCAYMGKWIHIGEQLNPVSISVNVSRMDIFDKKLAARLKKLVERYQLPTSSLRLEITESIYTDHAGHLISAVKKLKAMGFHVEMDDFGSGYSSLNMLKDVPIDAIKIDMGFLKVSENEEKSGNILTSVIRLAHNVDLPVIAEGVETKEQADYLKSVGCRLMQGYYFAKPMPAEDFEVMLQKSKAHFKYIDYFPFPSAGTTDFLDATSQSTLIFNSFLGGAGIIEYNGKEVTALRLNDKWYEVLGTTMDSYSFQEFGLNRILPEFRNACIRMLEEAIQTGEEARCETCSYSTSEQGEPIWLLNRVRCLAKKEGAYIFYIGIENIGEQKRLAAQLEHQRDRMLALYSSLPYGIVQYVVENGTRVLVRYNDEVWKFLGYKDRHQYEQMLFKDGKINFFHSFDLEEILLSMQRMEETGEKQEIDHRVCCVDGVLRWVHIQLQQIELGSGKLLYQATFTDITEQMNTNLTFLEQSKELSAIISMVPGGIFKYAADEDDYFAYVSPTMLDLLGYTQEEFTEKFHNSFREMVYHEDRVTVLEKIKSDLARTGFTDTCEYRIETKSGKLIWVYDAGHLITDEAGKKWFIVVIVSIDERKKLERKLVEGKHEIERIIQNIPCGAAQFHVQGGRVYRTYLSPGAYHILGYTGGEAASVNVLSAIERVHPDDRVLVQKKVDDGISKKECINMDLRITTGNGKFRWINLTANPVEQDNELYYYGVYSDITERQVLLDELRTSRESYKILLESSERMIFRYSLIDRTVAIPPQMRKLFDLPEVLSYSEGEALRNGTLADKSKTEFLLMCEQILAEKPCERGWDILFKTVTDGMRWFRMRYVAIRDIHNILTSVVFYMDDVTESKEEERRLLFRAERDGLTGLYTRAAAEERIRAALEKPAHNGAMLIFDVDNLKEINDSHGHAGGDRTLRMVAAEISHQFDSTNIVGRLGGDEFIAYLPGIQSEQNICEDLQALLNKLSTMAVSSNSDKHIRCSIGIVLGGSDLSFENLYHCADTALYHVKRHGKDNYAFYKSEMEQENAQYKTECSLT